VEIQAKNLNLRSVEEGSFLPETIKVFSLVYMLASRHVSKDGIFVQLILSILGFRTKLQDQMILLIE